MTHSRHHDAPVRFEGRSRTETKRRALAYWIENQEALALSLRDFLGSCETTDDGLLILFRPPERRSRAVKLVRAFWR